jgi:hypothetical protein
MNVNGTALKTANGQVSTWSRRLPCANAERETSSQPWGIGHDRPYPMVSSAVQTLAREKFAFRDLSMPANQLPCRWAEEVARCVASGECTAAVLFCADPGLVACVANKLAGLRAVPVATIAQAARATLTLAANLLVVEMPGRTFFEIRQMLRMMTTSVSVCPVEVAVTLEELESHAHR